MTKAYLSPSAVGARLGLAPVTVRSYILKGMLPEPDAVMLDEKGAISSRGWLPETIDKWQAGRPRPRKQVG